ncbi:hypothetical protein R5U08_25110 [Streptomyces coeruleorubidus]|uniref:Uncharacterized protein n=2 Tax=Streptomyces coeruleorubidus TaxID=116188 RepID=A0ABZ0KR94_STRC4|nr:MULTISPECIES: hypothetical protein [Streptomyces]WOT40399.1 hypothetical protein R5U08_25110 [Streptomyces coeruleorubidus]
MTPPPGDDPRGSAGPDARSSAGPDARGETALGTGHGTAPHGIESPTDRATGMGTAETSRTPGTAGTHGTGGTPGTHGTHGTAQTAGSPGTPGTSRAHGTHLLPHDESDKLVSQLHHAVAEFVDAPRAAVEEADHVLEEIAARFTEAVTQRRRTLRHSWQSVEGGEGKAVSSGDTEQLRLALKDYRELAERLLHV